MARPDPLSEFIRDALTTGRSRAEITKALTTAGWSDTEIREGLAGWSDTPFTPPVPRPRSLITARDFFIYALLFIALGLAAFNLVKLLHGLIDIYMRDVTTTGRFFSPTRSVRWAIAVLIVAGPIYAWLTWRENKSMTLDPGRRRSAIRKWMTYIALLIAAMVFLGDIIAVVYNFLDGDLTARFLLKALAVAVVSGAIFHFYLRDIERMDNG